MGNASTKERSLTPPHGSHHQSSTNLSPTSRRGGPSGSGRLSNTLLGGAGDNGGGTGGGYSGRGRSRHGDGLFGLSGRETRERDREAEREARELRKAEREKERQKERERSLREESVDGGFLVTQGVYTGVEDFKDKIVRQLIIERRLAPFFKGLSDHDSNWTDAQLVAAVNGLPIPSPSATPSIDDPLQPPTPPKSPDPSDSANNLTVPIASRSRSHSYTSETSNRSGTTTPTFSFGSRSRAKTVSISSPRSPTLTSTADPLETNDPSRIVDGRPVEAVLYKDAVECPICFLYYPPHLNKTRCCDQEICSECFVQIKRPDPHLPEHHDDPNNPSSSNSSPDQLISEPATCPFCVEPEFGVIYSPPAFRRGIQFVTNITTATSSESNSTSSSPPPPAAPISPSLPPQSPCRRPALSVTSPEVVTTDRIRPDWSQKLATARAHAARRAAAATALHTAAYLMSPPPASSSSSSTPGGNAPSTFSSRRLIRRAQAELLTPSQPPPPPPPSTLTSGGSSGNNPANNNNNTLATDYLSRRSRMVDLEEMMLLEAIRLSLQDEEQRKNKPAEGKGKSVERTDSSNTTATAGSSSSPDTATAESGTEENAGSGLESMFNFRSLEQMIAGQEARRYHRVHLEETHGGGREGEEGRKGKGKDPSSSTAADGTANANGEDLRSAAKGKIVDRS
ncbi:hypothetical protein L873DRAFT_159152 [Choiromyces venosus 120613-1]|uniref:Uncharacterized protein n=1 Tax=Choiromyces venosus 120613-1 TaxID=1336337 RepID=A0A3N4J2T5_9PEZI|nr:hypothetical protein L873DRAFT_159152 [Choiromyces venosus 120613-1]